MDGIIVGVDGSTRAEAALRWARNLGDVTKQPVTAVMAWGPVDQRQVEPDGALPTPVDRATAATTLDELVERACGPHAHVRRSS